MADLINTKLKKGESKQFYKGDLGFHKTTADKVIIYKILTGKKLEVCKIIIDEQNNILKISTKPEVICQDQFEIFTFALEKDTTEFILNLIFENQIKAEVDYQIINAVQHDNNFSSSNYIEKRKKRIRKLT